MTATSYTVGPMRGIFEPTAMLLSLVTHWRGGTGQLHRMRRTPTGFELTFTLRREVAPAHQHQIIVQVAA